MLLLVTLRACWKASRPETLVESMSPMRCASENACRWGYRRDARGLERLFQHCAARVDRCGDRGDLAGIVRVGRVATALQRAGECVDVASGVERGGVTWIAAEQRYIILEALFPAFI